MRCGTEDWSPGLENITRSSADTGMSRKWGKFQFSVNCPFNLPLCAMHARLPVCTPPLLFSYRCEKPFFACRSAESSPAAPFPWWLIWRSVCSGPVMLWLLLLFMVCFISIHLSVVVTLLHCVRVGLHFQSVLSCMCTVVSRRRWTPS